MAEQQEPKELQISTLIDADLRTEFDRALTDRGRLKVKDAVSAALRLWLDGPQSKPAVLPKNLPKLAPEDEELVRGVASLLAGKRTQVDDVILTQLREYLRARAAR